MRNNFVFLSPHFLSEAEKAQNSLFFTFEYSPLKIDR